LIQDPYSRLVREYFSSPAHAGELDSGVTVSMEEQDVRLKLFGIEQDGEIQRLRFQVWGCPHVIAACEYVCRSYEGEPLKSLASLRAADIMQILPVPVEKTGRILVLEDAARMLGQRLSGDSAPR